MSFQFKNLTLSFFHCVLGFGQAFVQRCKDLEEVCDGKIQFSLEKGKQSLPVFGGMQGPSISRAIIGLSQQFERYMRALRSVTYNVLDVVGGVDAAVAGKRIEVRKVGALAVFLEEVGA